MPYFRPEIEAMAGYQPGEQPRSLAVIKLNTNENPYPRSPPLLPALPPPAAAPRPPPPPTKQPQPQQTPPPRPPPPCSTPFAGRPPKVCDAIPTPWPARSAI